VVEVPLSFPLSEPRKGILPYPFPSTFALGAVCSEWSDEVFPLTPWAAVFFFPCLNSVNLVISCPRPPLFSVPAGDSPHSFSPFKGNVLESLLSLGNPLVLKNFYLTCCTGRSEPPLPLTLSFFLPTLPFVREKSVKVRSEEVFFTGFRPGFSLFFLTFTMTGSTSGEVSHLYPVRAPSFPIGVTSLQRACE